MKIAFDIRGIEGNWGRFVLIIIVFSVTCLLAFVRLSHAASSTFDTPLPELASCKTVSNPLNLSSIIEEKGDFLLEPRINNCGGAGRLAAYLVPLNLADTKVTIASGGDILTQRINTAKALGLVPLPVSGTNGYYRFDTDFKNIGEKLDTKNYCLFIFDYTTDSFCINMYNSISDDTLRTQAVANHIAYSCQTTSLVDDLESGIAFALSPYTISATEFWYYGAEDYLRPQGLDISADFLEHSLLDKPADLEFDNESEVAKKIRESEEYEVVMGAVKRGMSEGKFTSDELDKPIRLIFNSGDLLTSIKKAKLDYKSVQTDNGYTVSITITDDYDFHPLLEEYGSKFFLTVMNNLAFLNQYLGVIHNYPIKIEMQEFIAFNNSDNGNSRK